MFFLYDDEGTVTQSVSAADDDTYRAFLTKSGASFVETDTPPAPSIEDLAVIGGELVAREPMGATISAFVIGAGQAVTLAGLPPGATVSIMGPHHDTFTAAAPAEVIAFDVPGTYYVAVSLFPLQTARFELEVTP